MLAREDKVVGVGAGQMSRVDSARIASINPSMRSEFLLRFRISLIHHDAALEGEVLSYSEIPDNRQVKVVATIGKLAADK